MKKLIISLALASAAIAGPVAAQTLPPAVIVVVDMEEVIASSAAGKQAQTELKTRFDAIQSRVNSLRTSFGTEEQTLLKSRPAPTSPPATITAWENKVKDFQTRKTQAEQDLGKREQDFQTARQYVLKQITDGAQPHITAVMKERGATIAMPELATLQHTAGIDVTADIIARLDKSLPRVSTTPPAGTAPAPAK
jgi:Skp family chaperone for outer membrane proteins